MHEMHQWLLTHGATLQYSTNSTTFAVATVRSFHPGFPGAAVPFCRNFERILDIGYCLMWKMKPWAYFFISIAWRPEGNYCFPLWNRGNVACHRSQLTIFQYEKPFAQAANWNLNRNLLGANCQSKYQHCVTILQSGAQTNNRCHCN